MQHIVSATGSNIRHCLAAARRLLGIKIRDSREVLRSGGEDGLWRVHLADGTIVECTLRGRTPTQAELVAGQVRRNAEGLCRT